MATASLTAVCGAPCARSHLQQRRRHSRLRCRAEAPGVPLGQQGREDVMARISKARQYKKGGQPGEAAQPSEAPVVAAAAAKMHPPPPPPPPLMGAAPASALPLTAVNVEQAFGEAAQQLASKEEAAFLQAVAQTAAAPDSSTAASSSISGGAGPQGAAAAQATSKEALLARMEAARRYKQGAAGGGLAAGPAAPGGTAAPAPAPASASAAPAGPPMAAPAASTAQKDLEQQRSFRTGGGNAEQAANWLQFADKGEGGGAAGPDSSLSAEQFTLAKEELKKRQEVEIITVQAGYSAQVQRERRRGAGGAGDEPGGEEAPGDRDELHKPKVATWGVFPRPRNISEAYGGGRNLRPGQALESEEAAQERDARVTAALKQYRQTLGLDVDPVVEARAQGLYGEGNTLLDQGLLTTALPKFAEAAELMALRTRLGGEARLQQAICLDSLGRNQEAYEIYCKLEGHSAPGVAKKAKRMLFGWKAAENLKVKNLSYQPTSAQWKQYFDAINRNAAYAAWVGGEEEEQRSGDGVATAVALAVMALPLGLVAARALLP